MPRTLPSSQRLWLQSDHAGATSTARDLESITNHRSLITNHRPNFVGTRKILLYHISQVPPSRTTGKTHNTQANKITQKNAIKYNFQADCPSSFAQIKANKFEESVYCSLPVSSNCNSRLVGLISSNGHPRSNTRSKNQQLEPDSAEFHSLPSLGYHPLVIEGVLATLMSLPCETRHDEAR